MKKIILTGDRPTGKLHLGHYVGSIKQRIEMQNSNNYDEIYIEIADSQALTDNYDNVEKVRNNVIEVAKDYLACGIDPDKSTLFIQSCIPELFELTYYYMNLVSQNRLSQIPTIKEEIKLRGFTSSLPMGFLNYPVSQAADITAFGATDVPVGDDNVPLVEITRDIVKKFNTLYGEVLTMPKAYLSKSKTSQRLVGIDGKNKMSKSLSNAIFLSDSNSEIERKVLSMYTDPNHININDKGNTRDNPVFIYLDIFSNSNHYKEYFKDKTIKYNNISELKNHYENGGLGDMTVKRFLVYVLIEVITPIREKRESLKDDEVLKILYDGSKKAREKASITLKEVKRVIGIDYFDK